MEDGFLLKTALIFSLVGISALFFISRNIDFENMSIANIGDESIGSDVRIKGIIAKVADSEKVIFVDVKEGNSVISVLLFKDGEISLKENQKVEIIGKIESYKGELELIGNEVKVLS